MEEKIQNNMVFLARNLANLEAILLELLQNNIISNDEREEILSKKTTSGRITDMLLLILRKDITKEDFLGLLRRTNNERCANLIEGIPGTSENKIIANVSSHTILTSKWWPEARLLIKNLHKRKIGEKFMIEVLHEKIQNDEKRMAVICESVTASKFSGMGGIGKTVTATWYAHHYEEEYEQIIWIDCSEGNLLQPFKNLAIDLEVKNRGELRDEEFPRKCFEVLKNVKTLFVFDDVEKYKGKDGINQFLPKSVKSIYCLITSRSGEWGTKNVGHGHISDFQLDIFSDEESLEFFVKNLDIEIKYTVYELKELCKLLCYLPLALQLALAVLNRRGINLQDYIHKTSVQDSEKIVMAEFDDYEKTINENVKISLDLISKETNGDLATTILHFLGYLKADDINSKFLLQITNVNLVDFQAAIYLLEKYSLISKTGKVVDFPYDHGMLNKLRGRNKEKVEMDFLSIHRLLQQVIRHNGKPSEKATLRKIFGCKGFIDYKLLPFTKYADEDLQNKFPKVKAKLLDQKQLHKLFRESRFEDAVQLARFIHKELKTNISQFNYAICLEKNGELEEAVSILEKLNQEKLVEIGKWTTRDNPLVMGILNLECDLSMDLVAGHLLLIHWKLGNKERVQDILNDRQKIGYSDVLLSTFIQIVHSELISSNYTLKCESNIVKLTFGGKSKNIELQNCSIDSSIPFPSDVEELTLWDVICNKEGSESSGEFLVNEFVDFRKMRKLTMICIEKTKMSIDLSEDNISLEYLNLWKVKVVNWEEAKWTVGKMVLEKTYFVEGTYMKVKKLEIGWSVLDVSCLPQNVETMKLVEMKDVHCSQSVKLPNLKYLEVESMSSFCLSHFTCTQLTHIHFKWIKEVNLDLLPETVQKIKITKPHERDSWIVGRVRKIEMLILYGFHFPKVEEILAHFKTEELVVWCSHALNSTELMHLIKIK